MTRIKKIISVAFSLVALLLIACPTTDDPGQVLTLKITEKNDSLLHLDSVIVTVHSKDGTFSQEVFHGVLRDANQVKAMPLDPRVGDNYTVSIVGYKGGTIGVSKEVTFIGSGSQSKDLPIKKDVPETVVVAPNLPDIFAPSDTSIAEGDSLHFRVSVRNAWSGVTSLTLKDTIPGAALDKAGRDSGDGYFTWRPNFDQGRTEPYAITFVYASANQKVEKITRIKVVNVNRPPKLAAIPDQKAKENETLTFKVEGADPDHDSLSLTAADLPTGASFSGGTFTWKPAEGQAGNYTIKFHAFDGSDSDFIAVLVTVGNVDVPPPITVKIISPSQDTTINFTPITILYTVNGTQLQKKFPLKDGKNRIRIDTTVLNRAGFDTVWVTLDTVPPGRPIVNGASPVRTRTPTWNWTSGGSGVGIYRYRLDNDDMSSSTILSDLAYTASKDLDVGTHTLYVQERDAAGNWSSSGRSAVRIDTTKPVPPTVTVSPASPTNNPLPGWNWTPIGDDLSGLFRYKVDTNDFRSGAVETQSTHVSLNKGQELTEGLHALYVQQQDSAGNWSNSGTATILIDLTPPGKPTLTTVQTSPTNVARPTWNISSGVGGMGIFRAKLDDTIWTQGAKSGTITSFASDSALAHGKHTLYVQERDSAGNWSATQSSGIMIDLIPPSSPVFDSTPRTPLNSLQPNWTWTSGGNGGMGTYRCKVDDTSLTSGATSVNGNSYSPSVPLTEGIHTLHVQERDSAGNWSPRSSKTIVLALRGYVGGTGFSASGAYSISMALTSLGVPYVAFKDASIGDRARVMRLNTTGTAWEGVSGGSFSDSGAFYTSLALTSAGVPYVAFRDAANGQKATVIRPNAAGTTLETVGNAGFSAGGADYTSLALTSSGVPYVAFTDEANGYKATVMRFNAAGAVWETVGSAGFSPGDASYLSLALNSSGVPYVAFRDYVNGNKATVMRYNAANTTWETVGGAGFSAGGTLYNGLVLNSAGTPYVVFKDLANGQKATVMRLNASGTAWETLGGAGFSSGGIDYPSLKLSPAGVPYVAFSDAANGNKATVMRLNDAGTAWETVGSADFSPGSISFISLALTSAGVPYIAFTDEANGNKAAVMKTAFDP